MSVCLTGAWLLQAVQIWASARAFRYGKRGSTYPGLAAHQDARGARRAGVDAGQRGVEGLACHMVPEPRRVRDAWVAIVLCDRVC